jgi:hypothetical protein
MKNNLKHLEKQLAGLAGRLSPPHPKGMVWTDALDQAKHDGLVPGERIVEDYYLNAAGETVIIKERISADFSDTAKDLPHGSWDQKYLDDFNRNYEIRGIGWRTQRRL